MPVHNTRNHTSRHHVTKIPHKQINQGVYTAKGDDILPCDRSLPRPPFLPPAPKKSGPFGKPGKEEIHVEIVDPQQPMPIAAAAAAAGGERLLRARREHA